MKKNKVEIVIVLDRSGSMSLIKNDMEGNFKTFLEEQKNQIGVEKFITLYQFDSEHEKVYELVNIKDIDSLTLTPRGATALLDALGNAINSVGQRLNKTSEDEKPENVIFLVITDGEENASREFNSTKIKEMVELQQKIYNWKFVFFGANQDAVLNGSKYGFSGTTSMSFAPCSGAISSAFRSLNAYCSATSISQDYAFSDQERIDAMNK
jgi:uncharacterized protein YegL